MEIPPEVLQKLWEIAGITHRMLRNQAQQTLSPSDQALIARYTELVRKSQREGLPSDEERELNELRDRAHRLLAEMGVPE